MVLNLDFSQVVEIYVQIIGRKVGVASLFAPKIGLLCLSLKKVRPLFLLVAQLLVKTQKTYIRKLMKVRLKF
jgi:short subunit fatty acids transporter